MRHERADGRLSEEHESGPDGERLLEGRVIDVAGCLELVKERQTSVERRDQEAHRLVGTDRRYLRERGDWGRSFPSTCKKSGRTTQARDKIGFRRSEVSNLDRALQLVLVLPGDASCPWILSSAAVPPKQSARRAE